MCVLFSVCLFVGLGSLSLGKLVVSMFGRFVFVTWFVRVCVCMLVCVLVCVCFSHTSLAVRWFVGLIGCLRVVFCCWIVYVLIYKFVQ